MYKIINGSPGTEHCYFQTKEKALEACRNIKLLSNAFANAKVVKVDFIKPWRL